MIKRTDMSQAGVNVAQGTGADLLTCGAETPNMPPVNGTASPVTPKLLNDIRLRFHTAALQALTKGILGLPCV